MEFMIDFGIWLLIFVAGYGIGSTIEVIRYEKKILEVEQRNYEQMKMLFERNYNDLEIKEK